MNSHALENVEKTAEDVGEGDRRKKNGGNIYQKTI